MSEPYHDEQRQPDAGCTFCSVTDDEMPDACMGCQHEAKPKIYCFSNVRGGGDGIALALAEDGHCLGSHWCSHEAYVCMDLGVTPGARPDRHETYAKHYPDGYVMVFVPASQISSHPGIREAYRLNQELAKAEAVAT